MALPKMVLAIAGYEAKLLPSSPSPVVDPPSRDHLKARFPWASDLQLDGLAKAIMAECQAVQKLINSFRLDNLYKMTYQIATRDFEESAAPQ